jgi:phosphoribosylformimino-5-aminoimidazole carboxamide ribotide isomerase
MDSFTIFPAIDLRSGQVVRLSEGDPNRQTAYFAVPAETARQFIAAGAQWLHVINLDGAFGDGEIKNMDAVASILKVAVPAGIKVQFGGGLRNLESIEAAFNMGVTRVVIGTAIVEAPGLLEEVLVRWGSERIVAGLDARDGWLRIHGWQGETRLNVADVAITVRERGITTLVFTDIARDGLQKGLNLESTKEIARVSGLKVIASGGVGSLADIQAVRESGLAGVIVGRAIYENSISLADLFQKADG